MRTDDVKLCGDTPWLNDAGAARVCEVVQQGGYKIYFVGGCVRNAVLGEAASDIDLSTNAPPEVVMRLARGAGLKAVPTGIDHGTVTVVVKGTPYEITTFRRDVETDGRRAVVAFSDDIMDDARRRDFTMNALYARPDGTLVDPLGGLQDAKDRRIRFIEDADMRIREDYLRILRFFRFSAWYGQGQTGFDTDALDSIARNSNGLSQLSAERVGGEMLKLLSAPDPAPAVAAMRQTGVLGVVLEGADDTWLAPLVHVEGLLDLGPDPLRRLAALGGQDVARTLRLSKVQAKTLAQMQDGIGALDGAGALGFRFGRGVAVAIMALRSAFAGQPPATDILAQIAQGSEAVFPVKAADLSPEFSGPALGKKLTELREDWITSGFAKTKSQLLAKSF